jgi:hypothetical protein
MFTLVEPLKSDIGARVGKESTVAAPFESFRGSLCDASPADLLIFGSNPNYELGETAHSAVNLR